MLWLLEGRSGSLPGDITATEPSGEMVADKQDRIGKVVEAVSGGGTVGWREMV